MCDMGVPLDPELAGREELVLASSEGVPSIPSGVGEGGEGERDEKGLSGEGV